MSSILQLRRPFFKRSVLKLDNGSYSDISIIPTIVIAPPSIIDQIIDQSAMMNMRSEAAPLVYFYLIRVMNMRSKVAP